MNIGSSGARKAGAWWSHLNLQGHSHILHPSFAGHPGTLRHGFMLSYVPVMPLEPSGCVPRVLGVCRLLPTGEGTCASQLSCSPLQNLPLPVNCCRQHNLCSCHRQRGCQTPTPNGFLCRIPLLPAALSWRLGVHLPGDGFSPWSCPAVSLQSVLSVFPPSAWLGLRESMNGVTTCSHRAVWWSGQAGEMGASHWELARFPSSSCIFSSCRCWALAFLGTVKHKKCMHTAQCSFYPLCSSLGKGDQCPTPGRESI